MYLSKITGIYVIHTYVHRMKSKHHKLSYVLLLIQVPRFATQYTMAPPQELEEFFKECVFFSSSLGPCLNKIERIGE